MCKIESRRGQRPGSRSLEACLMCKGLAERKTSQERCDVPCNISAVHFVAVILGSDFFIIELNGTLPILLESSRVRSVGSLIGRNDVRIIQGWLC